MGSQNVELGEGQGGGVSKRPGFRKDTENGMPFQAEVNGNHEQDGELLEMQLYLTLLREICRYVSI
jgi:hypothetical protein